VHALVTTGPAVDPASLPSGPRVAVERWAPNATVLPQCDAVVTHGGHGTVMSALGHGVPVVCIPMGRDQADVAARAAWHGAGVTVSRHAKAAQLRDAIECVLRDPAFKVAARRIEVEMQRDHPDAVAEELEALAIAGRRDRRTLAARVGRHA